MPLLLIRGDITKLECDAIVNAANSSLLGGGGVDGAIHRAAGPRLLEECRTLHGCDTGDAKITGGYDLPARYVIHTVGPVWYGGTRGEEELLRSCYRRSLELACANGCESVAFPLISCGVYGYPVNEGFRVARDTIVSFLADHDLTVYIVIFGGHPSSIDISDLKPLVRSKCSPQDGFLSAAAQALSAAPPRGFAGARKECRSMKASAPDYSCEEDAAPCEMFDEEVSRVEKYDEVAAAPSDMSDLAQRVAMLDESFSQMLLRKIDELGMTDVECYKKANLDRKHFSKIRSDKNYRPKKQTVLALAIALKLPEDELRELLMKAGYALSDSNITDVIIGYFVEKGNYDIYDINEALFAYDQPLLGAA